MSENNTENETNPYDEMETAIMSLICRVANNTDHTDHATVAALAQLTNALTYFSAFLHNPG